MSTTKTAMFLLLALGIAACSDSDSVDNSTATPLAEEMMPTEPTQEELDAEVEAAALAAIGVERAIIVDENQADAVQATIDSREGVALEVANAERARTELTALLRGLTPDDFDGGMLKAAIADEAKALRADIDAARLAINGTAGVGATTVANDPTVRPALVIAAPPSDLEIENLADVTDAADLANDVDNLFGTASNPVGFGLALAKIDAVIELALEKGLKIPGGFATTLQGFELADGTIVDASEVYSRVPEGAEVGDQLTPTATLVFAYDENDDGEITNLRFVETGGIGYTAPIGSAEGTFVQDFGNGVVFVQLTGEDVIERLVSNNGVTLALDFGDETGDFSIGAAGNGFTFTGDAELLFDASTGEFAAIDGTAIVRDGGVVVGSSQAMAVSGELRGFADAFTGSLAASSDTFDAAGGFIGSGEFTADQ